MFKGKVHSRRSALRMLAGLPAAGAAGTFSLCPDNPRCFVFRGTPLVLITATEHYGAVLNGEFEYVSYLEELARNHLNLSRLFTFYRELEDSIPPLGYANTLAPRPGREVMPWKRTGPGKAKDGGLKFDLTQWNPEYFRRLKHFLGEAARRDIVVEVVLFCNPYRESIWSWFPCYKDNNVNGAGGAVTDVRQFMEQHDPSVFEFQSSFTRKIVQELNGFDNLYFEICNETATREREAADRQAAWHLALAEVVRRTEAELPKKHLIAVNAHQRIPAYREDGREHTETGDSAYLQQPLVDILNYHYISRKISGKGLAVIETGPERPGNIWAFFRARDRVTKPLVFDENYSGVIRGAPPVWDRNRMEAWETILSGGSGFDHLDWSFTPQDATGSGRSRLPDGRRLDGRTFRRQLGLLAALWRECGPEKMAPNGKLVVSSPDPSLAIASSRNDGKIHVVYLADPRPSREGFGEPIRGRLSLRLPQGRYRVRMLPGGAVAWRSLGERSAEGSETILEISGFQQDCAVVLIAR